EVRTRTGDLAPTPVALRFEVARSAPARYAAWSGHDRRPRVQVRPVSMGARGRWVKSGISWNDVSYADQYPRVRYPTEHLNLLRELAVASRSGSRHSYPPENGAHRSLHTFGPSLWRLLRQARETGLELVAEPPITDVRVADHPASLQLDLTRGESGDVAVR